MGMNEANKSANNNEYNRINSECDFRMDSYLLYAGMSHEMRTHMNAIVGFSSFIGEKDFSEKDNVHFKNQVLKSCEHLLWLFDSFLDSASIDSSDLKVHQEKCRLNDILDDLLLEFKEILNRENNIDIVLFVEKNYPDSFEVSIDAGKVIRVIRSLLCNAINARKSGYIKIGYRLANKVVTFYVTDSVQNYTKCKEFFCTKDFNKTMSEFFDASLANNIILSRKIIGLLGGTIWTEYKDQKETKICFTVPEKNSEIQNSHISSRIKKRVVL
jgi:signal transduction histidine kinase